MLPRFSHLLVDLSQMDPAKEESEPAARVILQLMKLARKQQLTAEFFEWFVRQLREAGVELPQSLIKKAVIYAFTADGSLDVETILDHLENEPKTNKAAMSIAEYLQEKGRQRGFEEGRNEGREDGETRGMLIGEIEATLAMLGRSRRGRAAYAEMTVEALEAMLAQLQRG
jgi:predicted transposase YdaD